MAADGCVMQKLISSGESILESTKVDASESNCSSMCTMTMSNYH